MAPSTREALREKALEDAAMFLIRTQSYREARVYLEGFVERWQALAASDASAEQEEG
jgi:hypothetical protein